MGEIIQFPAVGSRVGGARFLGVIEGEPELNARLRRRCSDIIEHCLIVMRASPWMTEEDARSHFTFLSDSSKHARQAAVAAQTFIDFYCNDNGDEPA